MGISLACGHQDQTLLINQGEMVKSALEPSGPSDQCVSTVSRVT